MTLCIDVFFISQIEGTLN